MSVRVGWVGMNECEGGIGGYEVRGTEPNTIAGQSWKNGPRPNLTTKQVNARRVDSNSKHLQIIVH